MENTIVILSPRDGDMLNDRDGQVSGGVLLIPIRVLAPAGLDITINGIDAAYFGGEYTATVALREYRSTLTVLEKTSGYRVLITVYRLLNYTGKYRLSLDDNIWFLQDIAQNAQRYKSIFDNPYLGFYRQVHETYGTKVHINIYYQTKGFDLKQMPATFRSQWRENAHWLRLSFHALQDEPDMPYITASYDTVRSDCERVMEQVDRFAGAELMGPVTTLHWGEATVQGCRALRDCGFLCQVGDFNVDNDLPPVSYYLNAEQRRHINRRSIWVDNAEGILFFRCAIIIDCHNLGDIRAFLDDFKRDPHRSGFMDLLIHEQYFYPAYTAHQPDYRQKVLTAVQWADDNGYKPAFLSECVFA